MKKTLLKLLCSLTVSAIYTPAAFATCSFLDYSENGYGQKAGYVTDKGLIYHGDVSSKLIGRVVFTKGNKKKGIVETVNVYSKSVEYTTKNDKSYKKSKLTQLAGSIRVYNDGQRNIYDAKGKQIAFLTGEATINRLSDTKEVGSFSLDSKSCYSANGTKGKRQKLSVAAAAFVLTYQSQNLETIEQEEVALLDL